MKKNFVYAMMSAIALSGAVSFSACSSSDELVDNPNYDSEKNAVKTQFTISLPNSVAKVTRQSAAVVQDAQDITSFRGFDNMVLIPYGSISSGDVSGNRLTTASIVLNPASGDANTLPEAGLAATNNSYVYQDVSIPVGTMGFLFYGKAIDETGGNFVNGALTAAPTNLTGENTTFTFSLVPAKGGDGTATTLLGYINDIAGTTGWWNSTNAGLKELYDKFVTLKAGSTTSISAALEDLYESLMNNTDAVSVAICSNITASGTTYTAGNEEGKRITLGSTIANYPGAINLPDGAVGLVWTTGTTAGPETATWATSSTAGTWNTGGNFTALENYVYPASLYYRANSPVVVSTSKQSDKYSGKAWSGDGSVLSLYTNGGTVLSTTQSVAMVEQIQYAVAQLKSLIGIEATTLKDRKGDEIKIGTGATDDGTFKVTGILIGGQQNVDWQFLPITSSSVYYTIYDKEIPNASNADVISAALSGTAPAYSNGVQNYTLALETPKNSAIRVAIEFENNAKDFMGVDGMIAKGTKFYLVATLNPASSGGNFTDPQSSGINQVFKQDYVTTAIFKIDQNLTPNTGTEVYPKGLGAAYNVIPDLRTPKMELGLSVDLTWTPGLQFEITM